MFHRLLFLAFAIASAAVSAQRGAPAPGSAVVKAPEAWERRTDESFENRGLAQVERVGQRWALTILCRGRHSVYLEPGDVDPALYSKAYIQARYRYVDRVNENVACVRAPCAPVTERRILLERVDLVAPSETAVRAAVDRCEPETAR